MLRRIHLLRLVVLTTALAVVGLVGLSSAPSQATDYHPEYGTLSAASGQLQRGCHLYTYGYALTPPEGQWALETYITDSNGASAGSGAFLMGADPEAGNGVFKLCVPTAVAGTYTLNGKVSVDGEGTAGHQEGFLTPVTFTLTAPPKKKHHKIYTLGPIRIRR